jgi:hypothetical protein
MKAQIKVTPCIGSARFEGVQSISTDLLLLPRLAGITLNAGPQADADAFDVRLNGLIARKSKSARFKGELGQYLLLNLDPRVFGDQPQRYLLLAGIGSYDKFNARAACQVFQLLVDQALELGVARVTIPFPPKRMTGLNYKGTAHILKEVLEDRLARVSTSNLEEVQVLCSPQARKHIEEGLHIPSRHQRDCCVSI